MIKLKPFITSLSISLGVGLLSSILTSSSMNIYENINKPNLSPPSITFPIVWTILFILMGISAYLIYISKSPNKKNALKIYATQLIINFIWPLLFFKAQNYFISFICLIILWILILFMIINFYNINRLSGLLQIPYIIWVTFAGYLNFMVYILNH